MLYAIIHFDNQYVLRSKKRTLPTETHSLLYTYGPSVLNLSKVLYSSAKFEGKTMYEYIRSSQRVHADFPRLLLGAHGKTRAGSTEETERQMRLLRHYFDRFGAVE